MKRNFYMSAIFIGLFGLSGCVTASNVEAPENKEAYQGKSEVYWDNYVNCLADNGALYLKREYKNAPTRSAIKEKCKNQGDEFYKAVYVDSFKGRSDVLSTYRHYTAQAVLANVDRVMLGAE